MTSLLGRLYLTRGPLLLFAFQAAPIEVRPTEDGTGYRFTFAAGSGSYESRTLNCYGDVTSAEELPVTAAGVTADVWPSPELRVSGGLGNHQDGAEHGGLTGGVQVAIERPKIGGGFGVTFDGAAGATPSYYFRLGDQHRAHFRLDVARPEGTGSLLGEARSGVAWNQGGRPGSYGFAGWSRGLYSDETYPGGLFGELGVPVSERVALVVGASYRPAKTYRDATAKIGISMRGP